MLKMTRVIPAFVCLSSAVACADGGGPGFDDAPVQSSGGGLGTGGSLGGGTTGVGGVTPSGGGNPASGGSTLSSGGQVNGTGGTTEPSCAAQIEDAYRGMPTELPGTLEAENFDDEGYSDSNAGNEGESYRTDVDVDIKTMGDGHAIGWMTSGEWLEYTVNVEAAGEYTVTFVAAAVEAGRTLELSSCGTVLTEIEVPTVADWGTTATVETTVTLPAGLTVLRITMGSSNDVDLDAVLFAPAGEGGTGGAGTGGALGTGGNEPDGTGGELVLGEIPRFVGNITTFNSIDTEGLIYSDYWDQITPENSGKWGSVQRNATSAPDWSALDAIYDYSLEHDIVFKQHAFVWGSQQPSGSISEAQVREWMTTFCERYPATRLIDVVNEPPPHTTPSYVDAIGGGTNGNWQWITNSFIWAREACPNAILILNDFNNIEWSNDNQHFINITKTVLDNGGPIDAVGAQAHDLDNGAVSFQTVSNLLNKLHNDTGLPVYITEMDLSYTDDQQQLQGYQQYFNFFWEQEYIPGITIWGWIYGRTWNNAPNSGLVRDGQSRSAMTWLMGELGRPTP